MVLTIIVTFAAVLLMLMVWQPYQAYRERDAAEREAAIKRLKDWDFRPSKR